MEDPNSRNAPTALWFADGTTKTDVIQVSASDVSDTILVMVPKSELGSMYAVNFVVTIGGHDGFGVYGYRPVSTEAEEWKFGGADPTWLINDIAPRVVDIFGSKDELTPNVNKNKPPILMSAISTSVVLDLKYPTEYIAVGDTLELSIVVNYLPRGLSGYKLTVELSSNVAKIVDVEFPDWAVLHSSEFTSPTSVTIKAVDLNENVNPWDKEVLLAKIVIEGVFDGIFTVQLSEYTLDDDLGDKISIAIGSGFFETFIVTLLQPLPGCSNPPKDLNNDGLYDDVNGNGRLDFNDVVALFKNMEWVIENNYEKYFDFNKNGRLDFNDIVLLFKMI
ncbi:MAG TPA: hypothetical protein ENJ59_02850 [Thermofilum sp.]|nr:hypothetical protein [Thermofilum sp.]